MYYCNYSPVSSTNNTDCRDITESSIKHHDPDPFLFIIKNALMKQVKNNKCII
jgi:hypothetical protein